MRTHQQQMIVVLLLVWTALYLIAVRSASGQLSPHSEIETRSDSSSTPIRNATPGPSESMPICRQQFEGAGSGQVSLHDPIVRSSHPRVIVIGFVGGFVARDDARHPELKFAARLRERYPSAVCVEVFGNHSRSAALGEVLRLLDANSDGSLTAAEKARATIIIYGHSWGASETVTLARALGRMNIPVLLTVQIDSIAKPRQEDSMIPPNVSAAVNYYQPAGLFHGRQKITAADPTRTTILGNFEMKYGDHSIDCSDAPWFARLFMKHHIEIENDPRIWDQIGSLIDVRLSAAASMVGTVSSRGSSLSR